MDRFAHEQRDLEQRGAQRRMAEDSKRRRATVEAAVYPSGHRPLKTADEYREELSRDFKDQPAAERERMVAGTLHNMMIIDRDERIGELERKIHELQKPPALFKLLEDKQKRAAADLADPEVLEGYRTQAISVYSEKIGRKWNRNVVLPEGEWTPGDEFQPQLFVRRQLGLTDDGLQLDPAKSADWPVVPTIFEIRNAPQVEEPAADDIADTYIGKLMRGAPA